jgi:8-oxo-dGTP pyrophosphatase MutT (NUDIX family)
MSFGLKQAPGWFQLLMNHVLHEVIGEICVVYLDDIIIYSKTKEQHLKDVRRVLELLHKAVLQIKLKKCKFFQKEIPFLGHIISKEGIKTDPEKIRAMQEMEPPKCLRDVQAILGLFQYYKSFILDFARIAAPIYKALKRQPKFIWEKEQQEAFETLKRKMTEAPILAHPDYDKPFILYSDASYSGLGHILAQKGNDSKEHVILYGGRKLQPAEQNYTITELECLGVVWGVRKNKQFLGQNNFLLFTDHKALETLRKQALPSIPRRTRWILELEQYNYTIKHRPGKKMSHVDYLSRYPDSYAVSFDDKISYINDDCTNWEQPIQEEPSRWEEMNFTYSGRWQQCQQKSWNPKYYQQNGACYQEGHHTHYYCKKCKFCFNPNGWWKKPTEEDPCDCNKIIEDPDEIFYEEPWNPNYGSENAWWEPTITVQEKKVTTVTKVPLATTPWWEVPIMVSEEDRMDHSQQVEPLGPTFALLILYDETGIYMSQRINPKKPMYLNYQVPGGKVDKEENGRQAAHRECYEETGLSIVHRKIKFLVNDPDYNCDIYYSKLTEEVPMRTEPEEMGSWLHYPWKTFEKMAKGNRTTPSLTKYRELIVKTCA